MVPRRDIQILLATHNAGGYLDAQLASLRRQDCAERIELLVRDDGSSDDTVARLNRFDPGPLGLSIIPGDNLGVQGCFLELMRAADRRADYFLFCDQDDVWASGKVSAAVAALTDTTRADPSAAAPTGTDSTGTDSTGPVLYCGRSIVTDANLTPLGLTAPAPRGPSFRNALIQNIAPGHTMALTRPLLDLACQTFDPARAIMHDHWVYLLAAGVGVVRFDPRPWTWYRTHAGNQIGYESNPVSHLLGRARRLIGLDRGLYTRQVRALVERAGDRLPAAERACAEAMVDQATLGRRWRFLRAYPLVHQSHLAQVVASGLFLLGRYRDR